MKRVICLLLVACFMVAALASCGGSGDPVPGTQAPSGQATDTQTSTDTLPSTETGTTTESETVTETVTDTDAPATDAPATDAPATDAPATDAPATDAPATDAPATDAPATDAPATDAPATDAPETEVPTNDGTDPSAPDTDAPATDAPATDAPATDAPATDAPATDAPATQPPVTNAPSTGTVETDDYGQATFTSPNDYGNVDLEGESLNIVVRNQLSVQREWYKDTPEDEVDEVIAMRNEAVASIVNVEVNYTLLGSSNYEDCLNTFNNAIMEDVDNDFHYYDVVANYAYAGANTLVRDYLANLADEELFPYFDFSLPCWNQSIVNTTLIDDQLYYITGDLNLSTFDKSMVVFVNKDIYTDKKQPGDPDDLQDVALEGNWDYEDLYAWASVYEDSNGDTVADHEDFYGITADFGSIPIDAMPYAWDLDFLVEEADGSHSYNIEGNDKISEAVDMAKALFNGANASGRVPMSEGVGNWDDTGSCTMGGYSEPITHFANDTTVFTLHLLYCTADDNIMLREMSSEFGLLPMPKYEEEQENYGTTSHDAYTLMTVIDHSESTETTKGEAISAYLQLSSEESYTNVRGYYINEIVKQKYFGLTDSVEKSQAIFDIIADNVEFTFISVYAPQLNNVLNSCWREVVTESNNVGATTAEEAFTLDQTSYENALEEVDTWLGLI